MIDALLLVGLGLWCVFMAVWVVLALVYLGFASRNVVPTVMSPRRVVPEVVEALELPERGVFYDLGCGDGRIVAAALAKRPSLQAVGVDNNPVVLGIARMRLRDRARLLGDGIMDVDLRPADRVFAYLGPELMAQLEPKLARELRPGARLVSQQFALPGRKPTQVLELKQGRSHAQRLYVYDF